MEQLEFYPAWDSPQNTGNPLTGADTQLQPLPPTQRSERVLVLEDDPTQLLLLTQHLESLRFQVIQATTIQQAKQHLNASVQLAILDIQLPDGSGFDLCQQIDEDPQHVGLPIIVLSSTNQADAVRKTRAAGGRFFLRKPYDPNVLLAIVERALGGEL